jgi:phage tail sheath protein FI
MIVLFGAALYKPAEFEIMRIEKKCGRWLINEADSLLQTVINTNCAKPFTPQTWARIKLEAEGQLYIMYREGKLPGAKPELAFFVKVGPETMTAADIAAHKLVLQYGIAIVKPAEFEINRLEKICN